MKRSAIGAIATGCVLASIAAAETHRYEIQDVGILPNTLVSEARDINDLGEVTGTSWQGGHYRAFRTTVDGTIEDIGVLPPPWNWGTQGLAINNKGQVVGLAWGAFGQVLKSRAFRYTPGVGIEDLGTLGGLEATALDINDDGHVIGWAEDNPSEEVFSRRAFLYTDADGMVDLGSFGSGGYHAATSINNHGVVAGESGGHPFQWTAQTGLIPIWTMSAGFDGMVRINNNNAIIGRWETGVLDKHGSEISHGMIVYYHSNTRIDIGTLPGFEHSTAVAINDDGQVIGMALNASTYETRYFLWTEETGPVPIDEALIDTAGVWQLGGYAAINNRGQMVTTATHTGSGMRAGLVNPILPADLDLDSDVDKADFGVFQRCFGIGDFSLTDSCPLGVMADFDFDADVDLADFRAIIESTTSPR